MPLSRLPLARGRRAALTLVAPLAVAAVALLAPRAGSAQVVTKDAPPAGQPPAGGAGMGRGGGMQAMLLEGITLTAAQQAQVDSIRGAFRERMMAGGRPAPGERPDSATMAARRQLMEQQRDAIRAVLTADQQKTFDANAQRMQDRMRERSGGGPR